MANTPNNKSVVFEHADIGYGKRAVIADLNLILSAGDYLGIVGPNGCGKTTILKAMLGILRPLQGQVRRDTDIRFGYVPQTQYIDEAYPLTAMEVALMGRYPLMGIFGRPSKRDKQFVRECLDHAGIADLANRPYRELSGGQKQRTLIARALAAQPGVLILDEPTNDMDIGSEYAIMELLKHLHTVDGLTIVMVSHLLNVVVNYVDNLMLIADGRRIAGKVEEVLTSRNLTEVYQVPIEVTGCGSKKVVLTGGENAYRL